MKKNPLSLKKLLLPALAFLLAWGGSACASAPAASPLASPVVNTQVVVRQVTQAVTAEVTRIVTVEVTVTPQPSATPAPPPDPNGTSMPSGLPQGLLPGHSDCLYGPAAWYEYKTSYPAGTRVDVPGRSEDANWLNIEEAGGWNSCWIPADQVQLAGGQVQDLPVLQPLLPVVYFDLASPYANAKRNGDQVILSWKAVPMSRDEIRGYLVRAKLCSGGHLLSQDIFIPMTYEENVGTLTYTLIDQAGCVNLSEVRMISYTRRGFAFYYKSGKMGWERVFFPPHP
jgi:hypothetical protein